MHVHKQDQIDYETMYVDIWVIQVSLKVGIDFFLSAQWTPKLLNITLAFWKKEVKESYVLVSCF